MKTAFVLVGDYWHSAESILPLSEKIFDKKEWHVIYTERPEDLLKLETSPDIIVSFKDPIENDQIPTDIWCDPEWTGHLFDLVEKNGTGLILAHAAVTDLEEDHPIVQKMIHARFVTHPQQCPMQLAITATHPVTDGVGDFEFPDFDEQYQMEITDKNAIQILAETKTSHGSQPAVWVNELGKGRICCIIPAHSTPNLTCDGFRKLMENAVTWCCDR